MIKLSHSFQPLDNKMPDIIEINEKCLDNSDPIQEAQRREFVNNTSIIVKSGKEERDHPTVIYHTNREFVVEIFLQEKDSLGRIPSILSYGFFPDYAKRELDWIDKAISDIERFASKNKIKNYDIKKVKSSLENVWNKKKVRDGKIDFLFRLMIVIMIPLTLAFLLLKTPQSVQQEIPQPILTFLLEIQLLQPIQQKVPPPSMMQVALFLSLNNALIISLPKIKMSKYLN